MSGTTPALQPITPAYHLRILTDAQLAQMKSATLEILNETGVHCPSEKALSIYADHGADVNFETKIVKLPPHVVQDALSHAPRFYTMGARKPEFDLKLDGRSTFLATDGCGVETIDFMTRERRPSCKDDVEKMARISDYLPSIGFYWPIVSAQDHRSTAPLHELEASYRNTIKHVQSETIMDAKMAQFAIEMAQVIAGDEKTLRDRPPLSLLVCCIAPLGLDRDGMESALTLAEAGQPVGFMSMANAGSTGPVTLAGTLITGDAEIVAAMTLIQMAHPGAPVFHSMMPGIMHPHTGAFLTTPWEAEILYAVGVELAHSWGVPSLAGVYGTDADRPGTWQSAAEASTALMLCALCGAETSSGCGLLETCTLLYPEEIILAADVYHRVQLDLAGLDTSPIAMALDVIKAVGPRGHFLSQRHTRENMRKRSFSDLTMQPALGGGYRDPSDVARDKINWILEHHQPEPLERDQQNELTRILAAADKAFQ